MEKNNFWNDAAKYGAILGALLAVSSVLETWLMTSGGMSLYVLMGVEFIAVIALHYYLLHRFTRERSQLYSKDEGFSFNQAYSHVLVISGFAGIIVGITQAVYLHLVLGYSNYIDKCIASFSGILASGGSVPASMESAISEMFTSLQEAQEPSVLQTVWGGMFLSLLFGAIFGLIIAGVLSRAPKPFDTQE